MPSEVIHVTDLNFNDVIHSNPIVLIDFWAEWCMPCRMLAPVIEEIAREYAGKVLVGKINVDENPITASKFQIYSIPTLIIFKNGVEVDRIIGLVPKSRIEAYINKYVK
ncbi:MAG: thioredoxin [Candidatus Bathyarchaeia archaeon]